MEPTISPEALADLVNQGERMAPVVARLLSGLSVLERAEVRDAFIQKAARFHPHLRRGRSPVARAVRSRLETLASMPRGYCDLGTFDGCLFAALVLNAGKVPSFSTTRRAVAPLVAQ